MFIAIDWFTGDAKPAGKIYRYSIPLLGMLRPVWKLGIANEIKREVKTTHRLHVLRVWLAIAVLL